MYGNVSVILKNDGTRAITSWYFEYCYSYNCILKLNSFHWKLVPYRKIKWLVYVWHELLMKGISGDISGFNEKTF